MLSICVLASGSGGNSALIESQNSKILIDAGISEGALVERLSALSVHPSEIDGILVTHTHTDHICGLKAFVKKYNTTVYLHKGLAFEM